jgi:hypothetical protein
MRHRTSKSFIDSLDGRTISRIEVTRVIDAHHRNGREMRTVTTSSEVMHQSGGHASSSSHSGISTNGATTATAKGAIDENSGNRSVKVDVDDKS